MQRTIGGLAVAGLFLANTRKLAMICPLFNAYTSLYDTPQVEGGPFGASVSLCGTCVNQLTAPRQMLITGEAWR